MEVLKLAQEAAEVYLAKGDATKGWLEFVRVMREHGKSSRWLSYGTVCVLKDEQVTVNDIRGLIDDLKGVIWA